jgi:hypothetical protein
MTKEDYAGKTSEIYFNSVDQKKKYCDVAHAKKCTFSKYVLQLLEKDSLPPVESVPTAGELQTLRERNRELQKSNRDLAQELEVQEQELQRLRNEAFLQSSGEAALDEDLLLLLQAGPIHSPKLLEMLKINPSDAQTVRAITRQLEVLEATGFIARGPRGWRWLR